MERFPAILARSLVRGAVYALFLCSGAATFAQSSEPFFKGKTITIISPADPGGSYDLYARLVAEHLTRHIPGEPTAVVQNMPGAGGLRAINYMASLAPRDGTYLEVPVQDVALSEALAREGVKFHVAAFNWIGRIAPSIDLEVTWRTSKVRTLEDARRTDCTVAATGPDSPTSVNPNVLNALIGAKFKVIQGYNSNAQMSAAMERGETDGAFATWATLKTTYPSWIRDHQINELVVYSTERYGELPDVPAVTEFASNEPDRQVLGLLASTGVLGRSLMTAPDVPSARVAILRAAFDAMVSDPLFLADLKRLRVEFGPMPGAVLQNKIGSMAGASPEVLNRARTIIQSAMKR